VTKRRRKISFCLGLGAILLACLSAPLRAQDEDNSNSSQSGTSSSLSADDIISSLRQDPKLLQQVKDDVAQKAQDQGRWIDPDDLNDEALFQMIRDDRSVRALTVRELQKESSSDLDDNGLENNDGNSRRTRSRPSSPNDGEYNNSDNRDFSDSDNREWNAANPRDSSSTQDRESLNPDSSGRENRERLNGRDSDEDRESINPGRQPLGRERRPESRTPPRDQNQPATSSLKNPYPGLPSAKDLYRQFPSQEARLQRFGASIFIHGTGNTDLLPIDLPAGPDYVLGPGDGLFINLWGSVSQRFKVTVDRGGQIALPEAGAVMVAGRTVAAAQQQIQNALSGQFKNARIDVSLTRLRTVRVYVVGDVAQPGAYDLSSLSTPLNALFAAKGPTPQGSLRVVRHFRGNQLLQEIDLYDLILKGMLLDLDRLQPGDSILVPPSGAQITVAGMVKRPAIYELRSEKGLAEVLDLAGGLLVSAALRQIKVERIEAHEKRVTLSVNVPDGADANAAGLRQALGNFPVQDGDRVTVSPILPYSESTIYLQGHVFRPGKYSYHAGMEIAEVLRSYQDLLPEPAEHAEIIRLTPPDYRPKVIQFKLGDVMGGEDPIVLEPFDTIRIFGRYEIDAPKVSIYGEVLRPGDYPLSEGMRASDLVRMAGGFKRSAVTNEADITSYVVQNGEKVWIQHAILAIAKALAGDSEADFPLKANDVLSIRQLSGWKDVGTSMSVKGEVLYPGTYGIEEGEKLSTLLKRAGGFRPMAYPEGAVLERVQVRQIAEKSKLQLIQQVEMAGQNTKFPVGASATDQAALLASVSQQQEQLLATLRKQPASGRLVIMISDRIEKWENTVNDIELRAGDMLTIPRKPNFVIVTGQVYNSAALTYLPGMSARSYLREAGGPTEMANKKDIYIIRANGAIVGRGGSRSLWEGNTLSTTLHRGDTIVVPEKLLGGNQAWKNVIDSVQVVSSLAIAARVAVSF
jgi:protein involved in polysaccharide export with SLBB domain